MPLRRLGIAFLLALSFPGTSAAREAAVLTAGAGRVPIAYDLLEDPDRAWTIEDVVTEPIASRFRPSARRVENLGLSGSAWWLRFRIQDEAPRDEEWLLELEWALTDLVEVYAPSASGGFTMERAGDSLPFHEWSMQYRNPTFVLPRAPTTETTYHLRIESRNTLILPLVAWSPSAFFAKRLEASTFVGAYAGAALVIVVSGLLLFLLLRDVAFAYFVAMVTCFVAWQGSYEGLFYAYVWPDAPWWSSRALHLFGVLGAFSALGFARSFLATRDAFPRLDRFARPILLAAPAFVVWPLVDPSHLFAYTVAALAVYGGLWILVVAIRGSLAGSRPARYFLVAWAAAIVGVLAQGLRGVGLAPSTPFVDYGLHVGILVSFVTLSLGLVDRIIKMRGELAGRADDIRRLEREDAAKRRFLATASHDLRQPLHAIGLFLEALRDRVRNPEVGALVGKIQASAGEMGEMFNALLDLSKLDAGMIEPRVISFPLRPLLERLASEIAPQAYAKGLRLDLSEAEGSVRSDPLLLSRILRNLLANALRYTDRGVIALECTEAAGDVRIRVRDTGRGIPQAKQREIFDEYRRFGDRTEERDEGLGLGLAIVRRLAALLGHSIEVESAPGRGSTFTVTVPRSEITAEHATRPAETRPLDPATLAVVVDDDPAVLDGMRALLESWGCRVQTSCSIAETERRLREHGRVPSVVFADYHLGDGTSGIDAIEAVQQVCGREVPALLLTGEQDPEVLAEAHRRGLLVVQKPVRPSRLRAAMAHVTGH